MNSTSAFEDRRQVFAWVHLISALTLMLFVILHWLEACCAMLLSVEAVLSVVMLLTYGFIRRGANLAYIEHVLMLCALVLFSALVLLESIESSGIYWLAGFPFVAYFVQQVKKARYWVFIFVVHLLVAAALQSQALIQTPHTEIQLLQVVGVVLFFWVFAHIYQSQFELRKLQLEASYQALAQQQDRMQAILDHSPIGIWMVDQHRNIQFINKVWSEMCGLAGQQAQGVKGDAVILPDVVADISDSLLAAPGIEQAYHGRDEMSCADGVLRTFDFIKVRLAQDTESESGMVAFAIDVTDKLAAEDEQKSLERQVQHSQRLESLGIMAGGIAHDFNNLLTVIQGSIELAKLEKDLTKSMQESLSCMDSAAHTATDLCRQMLDYSGKGVMRPEPLSIQALIEDMLSLLHASKGKNVSLYFHVDKQPPWLLADRGQMRQLLLNLVINASEAIGEQQAGDIHITVCRRQLDAGETAQFSDAELQPGKYVVLIVKDDGIGMNAETIEHIFDPFFTTKFAGRGLGMSAILGILRGHDAGMAIDSTLGVGTTMSVWLPEIDAGEHGYPANHGELKRALSGRVLIVDDEPGVLHVASRMLENMGLTVATASNGHEAVALFEKDCDFDWVLLDVTMPGMGGLECLQKLRDIRPDIYVAMASGFDAESSLTSTGHCQPDDFLIKPFTLDRLRGVVSQASE